MPRATLRQELRGISWDGGASEDREREANPEWYLGGCGVFTRSKETEIT